MMQLNRLLVKMLENIPEGFVVVVAVVLHFRGSKIILIKKIVFFTVLT